MNHRELATAGTAQPATEGFPKLRLMGTLPPADWARQAESCGFFRILTEGGARWGRPAPRPRLYEPRCFTAEIAEIAEPDAIGPSFIQAGKNRSDSEELLFLDLTGNILSSLRPPRALR